MSPGLIKGILVTGIVFGCESLLWAGYYWLRYRRSRDSSVRRGSTRPGKHLARAGILILLFAPSYYLFRLGLFNEFMLVGVMLGFSTGAMLLEILFREGGPSKFSPSSPMSAEIWQQRKLTKPQAVLIGTLGVALVALETAIVFIIVSPEVLALHWWLVLVLMTSLMGFAFAVWQWNDWEKKFGSNTTLSKS